MKWEIPLKPAEVAEQRIIKAILEDYFSINSFLPPERELSLQLGITRPTLREALQRLARDGWIEIHQGKQTRVKDYLKEGNLNVLSTLAKYQENLPEQFIIYLLQIRLLLAPTYAELAVKLNSDRVINILIAHPKVEANEETFSIFDLELHQKLTQLSGNPIFTLIFNGFQDLIENKSRDYFKLNKTKKHSSKFYENLLLAARTNDPELAKTITQLTMQESISFWKSRDMQNEKEN
jgi:GntR family negative regulator for fad regulon and positive regulator of fabA